MATFKNPYTHFYDNGLKYELLTELSPNVWKISRKSDREIYLAQDVTDALFTDISSEPEKLTDFGQLLAPNGHNMLDKVKSVLNHPNLVSLVDCFALQFSNSGKLGREQWFAVWEYGDAGNLGNLFVASWPPSQDHATFVKPEIKDEDVRMEDTPSESEKQEDPRFLPESFCWHVLTSLLKALAWLHDGVHDVVRGEDGKWDRLYENFDWQPMLHRNIHPQNIFLGYPRRREWYGPVKLGNYRQLFISGHCQTRGHRQAPTLSKAIGPPPDQDFARLEDLIAYDMHHGSVYPHQPNQPYTMVSEYRAVGEIIQGMMIEPTGSKHMKRIQSQSVRVNLRNAKYSARLKNLLVKLMESDPWHEAAQAAQPNPSYVTSNLYREAQEGAEWFLRLGTDEADAYVTSQMAEVDDYVENKALKATELLDSFQNVHDVLEYFASKS
ncbi:hypothetical protein F4802DRAFT_42005 [Xylaria palmicola]|nr:hypothetical protein F4802DRAFT_42005 [Xylaria palmicola]